MLKIQNFVKYKLREKLVYNASIKTFLMSKNNNNFKKNSLNLIKLFSILLRTTREKHCIKLSRLNFQKKNVSTIYEKKYKTFLGSFC